MEGARGQAQGQACRPFADRLTPEQHLQKLLDDAFEWLPTLTLAEIVGTNIPVLIRRVDAAIRAHKRIGEQFHQVAFASEPAVVDLAKQARAALASFRRRKVKGS